MVANKRWLVTVSELSNSEAERALEVDAANWVLALRGARRSLGEDGAVPTGASCAVDLQGVVTVLVPASRRRFTLTEVPMAKRSDPTEARNARSSSTSSPTGIRRSTPSVASHVSDEDQEGERAVSPTSRSATPISAAAPAPRTAPESLRPVGAPTPFKQSNPSHDSRSSPKARRRTSTVSFSGPPPAPHSPDRAGVQAASLLQPLLQRDEEPTADNPLSYRERAYSITPATSLAEAEQALQQVLADLQDGLRHAPRGRFINLAVFDHSWSDAPRRPPLIVLEWRDWRGEPMLQFLATDFEVGSVSDDPVVAERHALLLDTLQDLPHLPTVEQAMDLTLDLLQQVLPSEASMMCIYDGRSSLQVVSAQGRDAKTMLGRQQPLDRGLVGYVAQHEEGALRFVSPQRQAHFIAEIDGRESIPVQSLLLRPLRSAGGLQGVVQLINRLGTDEGNFTAEDLNIANYVADQLSDALANLWIRSAE